MSTDPFHELVRALAPLDDAGRKRLLRERLEAAPDGELPRWLEGALALAMGETDASTADEPPEEGDLSEAGRFAMRAASALRAAPAPPRPPDLVRRARYEPEESEAFVLFGTLGALGLLDAEGGSRADASAAASRETAPPEAVLSDDDARDLLPGLASAWDRASSALGIEGRAVFVLSTVSSGGTDLIGEVGSSSAVAATTAMIVMAKSEAPGPSGESFAIHVGAACLSLPEGQLAFLIGHALGRLLFHHDRLLSLAAAESIKTEPPGERWLPPETLARWLRWRRLADISADRVGFLACGDAGTAARAILRAELGLGKEALPADDRLLLGSATRLRHSPGHGAVQAFGECPGIHPAGLRILALLAFVEAQAFGPDKRDRATAAVLEKGERHPATLRGLALMDALAAAGAAMLAADGRADEREGRLLVLLLHRHFTDRPEAVLSRVVEDPRGRLADALERLEHTRRAGDGEWLIDRLIEIAAVDGSLRGLEIPVLVTVSERLGVEVGGALQRLTKAAVNLDAPPSKVFGSSPR